MGKKTARFFWTAYAIYVAFALVSGLDNLIFQPAVPGVLIGISCLVVVTWMIAYPLSLMRLK